MALYEEYMAWRAGVEAELAAKRKFVTDEDVPGHLLMPHAGQFRRRRLRAWSRRMQREEMARQGLTVSGAAV